MRVLLMMYGAREEVERMGLAVQLRAEKCDVPVAAAVMPAGGCQ